MDFPPFFAEQGFLPGHAGCPYGLLGQTGVGGHLTGEPEDFCVDEVPAYEPCGEGEHWFVHLRKRGISTMVARRILADSAGIRERDIGMAGRKDADAVTTQWLSLPVRPIPPKDDRLEILDVIPHRNKLRLGHLHGNRFTIRVHGVASDAAERLPSLIASLEQGIRGKK